MRGSSSPQRIEDTILYGSQPRHPHHPVALVPMLGLPRSGTQIKNPEELRLLAGCLFSAVRNHQDDAAPKRLLLKLSGALRVDLDPWLPLSEGQAEKLYGDARYLGRRLSFHRQEWDVFLWAVERSLTNKVWPSGAPASPFSDKREQRDEQLRQLYRRLAGEGHEERRGRVLCGRCLQALPHDDAVANDPETLQDLGLSYPEDNQLSIGKGWLCAGCLR